MGTRRVPWRDWDEWEETRAGLCGSDPAARDAALARVEIWRFRGRVPHAVESTAALMEARLHDRHVPGAVGPFLSEHMLRMVYAMGIVRMVNGAVDPSQKGKFAAPVMTLARKIGIPTALVDIRMEASHQELPSLSLLRHGTERALQWLFERYWAAQRFQLDELRRGARASVAALVDAESKRRRKARRAVEKPPRTEDATTPRDALEPPKRRERRKGETKTRRGRHRGRFRQRRFVFGRRERRRRRRFIFGRRRSRSFGVAQGGARQLFAAVSRDASPPASTRFSTSPSSRPPKQPWRKRRIILERANEGGGADGASLDEASLDEPDSASPSPGDSASSSRACCKTVASRLKKRWTHVHEELVLRAVDGALASPAPAPTRRRRFAPRTRARATLSGGGDRVFSEAPEIAAAAREDPMFEGVVARRKALAWHLLRRALAVATPTAAQMRLLRRVASPPRAAARGENFKRRWVDCSAARGATREGTRLVRARGLAKGTRGTRKTTTTTRFSERRGARRNTRRTRRGGWSVGSPGPDGARAFALVRDWTPCAVRDLPAHLEALTRDPARLDPGAALRSPSEKRRG